MGHGSQTTRGFAVIMAIPSWVVLTSASIADNMPPYMATLAAAQDSDAGDIAANDMLQLNTIIFDLYGSVVASFKQKVLAEHPVILTLLSGAGDQVIPSQPSGPQLVPLASYRWPTLVTPGPGSIDDLQ